MATSEYQMFEENFWSENGFDELRKLMKQGSDFVKEVMSVVNERAEIDRKHTNSLMGLVRKAKRANSLCTGSLGEAWNKFVETMESEADMYKNHAHELQLRCYGPLKDFLENKIRQRKPLEQTVDKNKKAYLDRYNDQLKHKKSAYTKCRELEQALEQMEVLRRRGSGTEKELAKLEKSSKKCDESLIKADREYRDSNVRTEEVRLLWEGSMYKCCRYLENLEHTRLDQISEVLKSYSDLLIMNHTPLQEASDCLVDMASAISADKDIELMCTSNRTGPNIPEQLLLETYEEDAKNHMNEDRRCSSLDKKIQDLEGEIERKQKEKRGVQTLSAAYEQTPDFVDEKGAADVQRQIIDANSILNLLKATHYKLLKARTEISGMPSPESPYSQYINVRHDKQGLPITVLSVLVSDISDLEGQASSIPAWTPPTSNNAVAGASKATDYGGSSKSQTSYTDDFDDSLTSTGANIGGQDYTYISRCNVLYDYDSQQSDELSIVPGDTIYVTAKIDNDWWQGNLNGVIGLFPASYVEEDEVY